MSTNLDIYSLTRHREIETINRFLDDYVDRAASEDRGDEEVYLIPDHQEEGSWEPTLTLTHLIDRGLDYPRRSFSVYMTTQSALNMTGALMHFTSDDQLVLGLSFGDKGVQSDHELTDPESELRARAILERLAEHFDCHLGWITVEDPPPHSEAEFREAWKRPWSIYFQVFPSREESSC